MKAKLYHAKIVTIAVEFEVPDDTPEEKLHELLADEVKEMHNDGYLDFYDGKTGDIVLLPLGCKIVSFEDHGDDIATVGNNDYPV